MECICQCTIAYTEWTQRVHSWNAATTIFLVFLLLLYIYIYIYLFLTQKDACCIVPTSTHSCGGDTRTSDQRWHKRMALISLIVTVICIKKPDKMPAVSPRWRRLAFWACAGKDAWLNVSPQAVHQSESSERVAKLLSRPNGCDKHRHSEFPSVFYAMMSLVVAVSTITV